MPSNLSSVKNSKVRNLIRGMAINTNPGKRNAAIAKICALTPANELFDVLQIMNNDGLTDHLLSGERAENLKQLYTYPVVKLSGANKEVMFQLSRFAHNREIVCDFFKFLGKLDQELCSLSSQSAVSLLKDGIGKYGFSHLILSRLALLHVFCIEEPLVQALVNDVLEDDVNRNFVPYYYGFYDLFDLSDYYQILLARIEDRFAGGYGLDKDVIAEWYGGIFFPNKFGAKEFADRISAFRGSSVFDSTYLLLTQAEDVRLEKKTKDLVRCELEKISQIYYNPAFDDQQVKLFDGKSAEDIYRISAWVAPSKTLVNWRRHLDKTYSFRSVQAEGQNRFGKLSYENEYFPKQLSLANLAHKPTTKKLNFQIYSTQQDSAFLRSVALLHCLLKGEQFVDLSEEQIRKILSQTQNLAIHFSKSEIQEFYTRSSDNRELVAAFLALCLLFDKEPNDDVEFDMRMQFQETVLEWFDGDILAFIKWLASRTPELAHYVFQLCSNAFIEKLYLLVPTFNDVLLLKEKILRWAAEDLEMENASKLADQVARERKIREVRGSIDDSRIFVDESWLSNWMMQNIHPSLIKYVRSMKGTSLEKVDANFARKSTGNIEEIREIIGAGQNHFLAKALSETFYHFCDDKVYGIRSYLGRRILHGTLKGHLYKQVKQIIESDKYFEIDRDGEYWNGLMRWLHSYETMISEMQNVYLRVKSVDHPLGLIDPNILSNVRKREMVQRFINNITLLVDTGLTSEEIIEVLPDWCWQILQVDLSEIQTKYLVQIRQQSLRELTSLFNLEGDSTTQEKLQINALYDRVENLHRNFATWFRRPESRLMSARIVDLCETIIVGLQQANSSFRPKMIYLEDREITIFGKTYHTVYDILDILIGNVERWGSVEGEILISRRLGRVEDVSRLTVSVTSDYRLGADISNVQDRITTALTSDDLDEVADQIDFTGIRRIRKMLRDLPNSNLKFVGDHKVCFVFDFELQEV